MNVFPTVCIHIEIRPLAIWLKKFEQDLVVAQDGVGGNAQEEVLYRTVC